MEHKQTTTMVKRSKCSPGDTEESTGVIPDSPGQLDEFTLQDKCVSMCVNECVFVRQHM